MKPGSLEAIDKVIAEGGDADDVLRAVVAKLSADPDIAWAGISFLEDGDLVPGPEDGSPDETRRQVTAIAYRGELVGELAVDGGVEQPFLENVAARISAYVLLGWDTGGRAWEP